MAHSRLYRSFLILQEAEKGYSIASDKPISAYTKIEGKNDSCRISFYAQNLKKDDYHMLLICSKKGVNKNISLGPLNINEQGRAEVSCEYSINDIADTGIPMSSISGAAIVVFKGDKLNVILNGSMNGEKIPKEWRGFPLAEGNKQEEMVKEESQGLEAPVANISEEEKAATPVMAEENLPSPPESRPELENNSIEATEVPIASSENHQHREAETPTEAPTEVQEVVEPEAPAEPQEAREAEAPAEPQETREAEAPAEPSGAGEKEALEKISEAEESPSRSLERKVNVVSALDNSEITVEELNALKAFIKEQELRMGIVPEKKEEEKESLPENVLEELEGKESRNISFDKVSPEIKDDLENLSSLDIKEFIRTVEENEFDSYEKFIEENKLKEKVQEASEEGFSLRGSVGEFFLELARDFEPLTFDNEEIKYCKWYRVPVESINTLCDMSNYNKYTVVYYPMINYYPYIKNHDHFIVGFKGDRNGSMKYLIYGIAGGREKQEQPYGGKSGFVTWMPCDKDRKMGYWLMFYDFKNSVIVVPVKQEE